MNNWWGIGLTLVLALGWLFSKYWVEKKEPPFGNTSIFACR